jgi:uncharacterized protein (TIGR02246 family)
MREGREVMVATRCLTARSLDFVVEFEVAWSDNPLQGVGSLNKGCPRGVNTGEGLTRRFAMKETGSEEVALQFVEKINARDASGLSELMTEDFVFVDYEGEVYEGREMMKDGFAEYFENFPEYKIHVQKICVSGGDVAFVASTTGSHVPPELEVNETLVFIARFEGGLVAEWRIYTDLEDVKDRLRQKYGT